MNIFWLDNDEEKSAAYHLDKHVCKQVIEYAQLLSTAHRVLDGTKVEKKYVLRDPDFDANVYKATHINHPSAVWVRQSHLNYHKLYVLWCYLMNEYTFRYGKVHACARLDEYLVFYPENIPSGEFTQPTPAMPDEYKVPGDSVQSYRNYYNGAKSRMFSWKNRETPDWIVIQ